METNGIIIWSEKIPDRGEDAFPTALIDVAKQKFFFAVYDGMGGAGSAMYKYGDKLLSGAYIAANETKKYLEKVADPFINGQEKISEILTSIERGLFKHLQKEADLIDKNPSRLKSNLIKRLPTTISAIFCETNKEIQNERKLTCLWAGDSRCYILTPENGLMQLTNDDLKGDNDAFKNLRSDAPMSNYCNADVPFKLNIAESLQKEPFILVTATDGCFGYLPSPFHFENLLLKTLMNDEVKNFGDWKVKIFEEIKGIAGDDYSMTIKQFGFESFIAMQDKFDTRFNILVTDYMNRYLAVEKTEFETKVNHEQALADKEQVLKELWKNYKAKYQTDYAKR